VVGHRSVKWFSQLSAIVFAAATLSANGQSPLATGAMTVSPSAPWVGQVVELQLDWSVDRAAFRALDGDLMWDVEPLVAEAWGKPTLRESSASGRSTISFSREVMATAAGRFTLSAASIGLQVQTGSIVNEDYTRAILESRRFQSSRGVLRARSLPSAPPGFRGFVGSVLVESRLEPASPVVGEPMRWTIALSGRGNWPMFSGFPVRVIGDGFAIQGAPALDQSGVSRFEQRIEETITLIPLRAGQFSFDQIEVVFFDPITGRYDTARSAKLDFEVAPGKLSQGIGSDFDYMSRPSDEAPALIAGEFVAAGPMENRIDLGTRVLFLSALVLIWLTLAAARAWYVDPWRQARSAQSRLRRILVDLSALSHSSGDTEQVLRQLLRQWQRETGRRWRVEKAEPIADDFSSAGEWSQLWREADCYLFGPDAQWSDDWAKRACAALTRLGRPPRFEFAAIFERQHWLPRMRWLPLIMLVAIVPSSWTSAVAATAVENWSERVRQQPLDVHARSNLAIVLAADGRTQEAAVQAGIAWIHEPRLESTRDLWIRLRADAGLAPPAAGGVMDPVGFSGQLATLLPGSWWQRLSLAFELLFVVSSMGVLVLSYTRVSFGGLQVGLAAVALGLVGALGSHSMVERYGLALEAGAVITNVITPLRELPVDTLAEFEPEQIQAGVLGLAQHHFLGWTLLELDDGRSGWVRDESLNAVWARR